MGNFGRKSIVSLFVVMLSFCFYGCLSKVELDPQSQNQEGTTAGISHSSVPMNETDTTSVSTAVSASPPHQPENSARNHSDIKILITDSNRKPVSNLRVSLKHLSGKGYDYTPDLSFTDLNGFVYGVAVEMKYQVILEDIGDGVVFAKTTSTFEVIKGKQEYTFIWPYEPPTHRKEQVKEAVVFEFKTGDHPLINANIELYVGHYETTQRWTMAFPEIINLGYSDEKGQIVWDTPKPGDYTIYTYVKKGDGKQKVSKQITISNIPYAYSIVF